MGFGKLRISGGIYATAIAYVQSTKFQKRNPLRVTNETGEIRRSKAVVEPLGIVVHKLIPIDEIGEAFNISFTIISAEKGTMAYAHKGQTFEAIFCASSSELRNITD